MPLFIAITKTQNFNVLAKILYLLYSLFTKIFNNILVEDTCYTYSVVNVLT